MFALLGLFLMGLSATLAQYSIHGGGGPVYHGPALVKSIVKEVDVEAPAHYDFGYSVHDDHTGDVKSQSESRKDDQVHGQYQLIDPDGYLRIVDYTSDKHNGFNAVVRREPLGHKAVAPVAKVAYAAPKLLVAPKIPIGPYGYQH